MALTDVDLSNLKLGPETELEGFDPEADNTQAPPPPDDGTYVFSYKLQQGPYGGVKQDSETKVFKVAVDATIVDGGKFDGRHLFPTLSTKVRKDGTTTIGTFLRGNGIKPPTTDVGQVAAVVEFLQGEPQGRATTRWRSSYRTGEGDSIEFHDMFKGGQRRHPSDGNGGFKHINKNELGEQVIAKAEIVRYAPIN